MPGQGQSATFQPMQKIYIFAFLTIISLFLYFPYTRTTVPCLRPAALSYQEEYSKLIDNGKIYQKILNLEYFPILETAANTFRNKKERLPGGDWKLHRFFSWMPPYRADQSKWAQLFKKLDRWEAAFPASINPKIMKAQFWMNQAWDV